MIAAGLYLDGTDPYELFDQLSARSARPLSPAYSFYLGYEMAKAVTALTLGKNYRQDDALEWGFLTLPELTRRQRRALHVAKRRRRKNRAANHQLSPIRMIDSVIRMPHTPCAAAKNPAPKEGKEVRTLGLFSFRSHGTSPTAKRLNSVAQGKRSAALGWRLRRVMNPAGVPQRVQPLRG